MTDEHLFWALSATSLALMFGAGLMERKQANRKNLDRPGWISWPLIQILALVGAVVAAVLALRA